MTRFFAAWGLAALFAFVLIVVNALNGSSDTTLAAIGVCMILQSSIAFIALVATGRAVRRPRAWILGVLALLSVVFGPAAWTAWAFTAAFVMGERLVLRGPKGSAV